MAEQDGFLPLRGAIGKLNFFKTKKGYRVGRKGGVDAGRIASDPAFQRTRENNAEFGAAGKAGKLLRASLKALIQNAADSYMTSRLSRQFLKALQADTINDRGKRRVSDGNPVLLEGFEFNLDSNLSGTLFAPFTVTVDRVAGTLVVALDPFVPMNMLSGPTGSSHFRIKTAAAAIDFDQQTYEVDTNSTTELPWSNNATAIINLSNSVTPNSTRPLFLVLGVEFYQEVNRSMYPLKNGNFNPLAIVKVDV